MEQEQWNGIKNTMEQIGYYELMCLLQTGNLLY